jgi:hypothetical protein
VARERLRYGLSDGHCCQDPGELSERSK